MLLLENTNSFKLNSFNGIAVKKWSLQFKQTKKKLPKNANKKKNPKQQNQQKTGRGADAQAPSCSTACSESCSAQLGAAFGCITRTASPQSFTQKSLKSFRYRQHAPNPDLYFFFCKTDLMFSGQTVGQLSRSASGSTASVSRPAAPGGTGLTALTFLQDLLQMLIRSHTRPWDTIVNITSCFTGS